MALRPRTLCPCLVLAIVRVAGALRLLPTASPFTLTARSTAITLLWNLRTRPKCPPTPRTVPPLHERPSAQITCTERPPPAPNTISRRRTCNRAPRPHTRRFRSCISVRPQAGYRPPQQGGSIPMSTPGSIPVSVEGASRSPASPSKTAGSKSSQRRESLRRRQRLRRSVGCESKNEIRSQEAQLDHQAPRRWHHQNLLVCLARWSSPQGQAGHARIHCEL